MKSVKRTYKDSLFRDIFRHKARLAAIYDGLFDEPVEAQDIELATLDWTFFTGIRNDVSFLVRQQHTLRPYLVKTTFTNLMKEQVTDHES